MNPTQIVEKMMQHDAFSQWLGIRVLEAGAGKSVLEMEIRPEMLNGFGIAHGAITYALADSALAFAANGHGRHSVSVDTSIHHLEPLKPGDIIRALAREDALKNRFGFYSIDIFKSETLVAQFRGTVYRTEKNWE
jgi:acyl-CoA thioesterase